ncbi:hypothetical protein [Granulicella sp. S156]|uniref:hypothetical protein n=1 Tax=Granulicella sp. S156 TaxID=1747224 RepID=UPI00131D5BFF|nr:hypothetical protein [Granulicella sp. S156]
MPTQADLDAAKVYTSIMEEAKVRALSINTLTNSGYALPVPLQREYCFLQLRMLCELIALGCLVAHGDIEETKSAPLQKTYHAGEIVKRLEKLHPNFYPSPRKLAFNLGHIHLGDYDREFLTKSELIILYGRCGDALHKGNLRQLLDPKNQPPADFRDLQEWGQKILNLLSVHLISRREGNFHLIVVLEASQNGGNVLVSVAESPVQTSASVA